MWLLDVKVDVRLAWLLKEVGIPAQTAVERGWRDLVNGDLVEEARKAGFTTLLTRDRLFSESASKRLKAYPGIAVVVLMLRQRKFAEYTSAFRDAWAKAPIVPEPGRTVIWPSEPK